MSLCIRCLHSVTRVCLSAGTQERLSPVTARCDRMLNHHCRRNPELQEELQIQAGAVGAGDVYTVRKMLEQGYSPKIRDANGGRCCTSLRRRERSAACACSSNTEVKAGLGLGRDVQQWDKESVGNDQPSLTFTINCGWFAQRDS